MKFHFPPKKSNGKGIQTSKTSPSITQYKRKAKRTAPFPAYDHQAILKKASWNDEDKKKRKRTDNESDKKPQQQ